ncbi:non-ribosomal peptide synthetase [Micromonospora sp. WMMA1363]|uniref:non-ribosomal peptide synthetase n=1 Tax=Micromonospora sp. WMMA1363 TaxID=3053985 RepID=UPI00259D0B3C|nr:non-ribosomal peptide synthetase [Micromonospora sp. WMMA1363]MDM4719652.1 non-ribosomal peptide synthetase [Micromonospora sp. WMMA1363]
MEPSPSIQERFAAVVRRFPDRPAITGDGTTMSYRELDVAADRFAGRLRALGVRSGDAVAVLTARTADVAVAVLGVVRTGACYVPLHDGYPHERLRFIVEECRARVLVADQVAVRRGVLPITEHLVLVDEDSVTGEAAPCGSVSAADPDDTAYIMYTSGSTGTPKGVAVPHRAVIGLADDSMWDSGRHDTVLSVAPFGFGVAAYELWVPLLRGGHVVVAPTTTFDLLSLRRWIDEHKISGLHLTAGLFRVVAHEEPTALSNVREVLTGGDIISPGAVRAVLEANPGLVVRAMYGATETSSFAMSAAITLPDRVGTPVPVGVPLRDVHAYLLDERLEPVSPGAAGELYLAGPRLALGYVGRPDLTADRFVADPFAIGTRMYRTGDVMRRNPDGQFEFVFRIGEQMKVRGFRVEPREIEAALTRCTDVTDAAVLAREGPAGEQRLVAYLVAPPELDVDAIRAQVARSLPEYMVPAVFVVLDALPLTENGKLDRTALSEPEASDPPYRAPRTDRQRILCELFAEVLEVDTVGIEHSFFDLNGQSLSAIKLVGRIRAALTVDVSVGDLFDAPTVAELDAVLDGLGGAEPESQENGAAPRPEAARRD